MTGRLACALVALVAACAGAACGRDSAAPPPAPEARPSAAAAPSPEQAAEARRSVVRWLECEECTDGELDAVLRLGPLAVPTLIATLREGPSPAAREKERRALQIRYADLRDFAARHPDAHFDAPETAWVEEQLAYDVARYQVRSAEALARLGGPAARQALADALGAPLRPDVQAAVRKALEGTSTTR